MSLEIEYLVEVLIRDLEGHVMGRQRLIFEKIRQTVMGFVKTGLFVEFTLVGQHRLADGCDVIRGETQPVKGVEQIEQGLKGFRLVKDRKRNKDAHTG